MKKTVIFDMHKTLFEPNKAVQTTDLSVSPVLAIKAMPKAIETFLFFYDQGYKITIISTSDIQSSRERLQYLLTEYDLEPDKIKQILKEIDILSMQFFGSKHNTQSWQEAMQPYQNIEYIFEDGEAKLQAAGEAARNLGHQPQLLTSVAEFWK